VNRRWTWFAVSSIALVLALAGLVANGLRFGLEFKGGRLVEYSTTRPVDLDALRSELAGRGFSRALVQQSGDGDVSVRTAPLSGTEEVRVEEAVATIGGPVEKLRDEFIGATVSGELLRRAVVALGLALGAQLLYLAFRFRWTYGASAVVAMLHDVLILLGVFAWLGKTIDGVFLASVLTVIGYSVNDSVVVFDRIREQRGLRAKEPLAVVANDACLQTIPRTINTGLGALFILAVLYLFGGDTLTDFALALLIGILVGTYSSIFTAAPLAVGLDRLSTEPSAPARGSSREGSRPSVQPAPLGGSVAAEMRAPLSKAGATRKRAQPSKRKRRR
jgi:SecD/SecF fusion protein